MEYERVASGRIKLKLTEEEKQRFSLGLKADLCRGYALDPAVYEIFDKAEQISGFDALSCLQAVEKNCGVDVYIARTFEKHGERSRFVTYKRRFYEFGLYRFDCVDDVINVCKALEIRGYDKESSLFVSGDGCFFLRTERGRTPFFDDSDTLDEQPLNIICEFGKKEDEQKLAPTELKCICKRGAVRKLAAL